MLRADVLFDDALAVADSPLRPAIEHPVAYSAEVQRKRLQVDTRKWAAAKLNKRLYGEGNETTIGGTINVSHSHDVRASAIEELAKRLSRKADHLSSQQQLAHEKGFPFSGETGGGVVNRDRGEGAAYRPSLTSPSPAPTPPQNSPRAGEGPGQPLEGEVLPPKSGARRAPDAADLAVNPFVGRVVPFEETELED